MDDITLDRVLSGDLTRLPQLPKRVVRIFISSTFTDMTLERNSLMERVYPRLKKYCRERHGLDFQVVDMRWGVRDEATDDHQTVNLCSKEIENCQRVSLGPNFIALIGDKYGFRPLLNRIKSTEYRLLRRCLIESDINTDFLDTWYKEDLNAVPAEYVLQPISSILKNFTNRSEPELQMVDQRIWQAIQERLHDLLLVGSSRLVKQGRMSEREQSLRYSISVTEREVIDGCLDLNETKAHCLVYVRTIVDLHEQLGEYFNDLSKLGEQHQKLDLGDGDQVNRKDSSPRRASLKIGDDSITLSAGGPQTAAERRLERQRRLIGKYIDLTSKNSGTWKVDEDAQRALGVLKGTKLRSKLGPDGRNLTHFQVHWYEQDGITAKSDEHKRYLDDLTDHFYKNLTRMVRVAVKRERGKVETKGLLGEVLQHSHYSLLVGRRLLGRSSELDLLRDYILTGSSRPVGANQGHADPDQPERVLPMLIYGVSGSGKTSVLARAAALAHEWIKQFGVRRRSSSVSEQSAFGPNHAGRQSQQQQSARNRWDRTPCVVMRFCCTTPASSSVVGMLTSICRQLQYNFYQFGPLNGMMDDQTRAATSKPSSDTPDIWSSGKRRPPDQLPFQQIPQDYVRLVYTFRQLLENCRHSLHKRRTFVIIIDSVERLSAPAECGVEAKFSWITNLVKLPPNVRLVVSCSSTGTSQSELADYLHLKRHFLRVHLRQAAGRDAEERPESVATSGSLDDQQPSMSESAGASDPADSTVNERALSKIKLLRRLILPAARLALGSRASIAGAPDGDMAQLQKPTQVRFTKDVQPSSSRSGSDNDLPRVSSNESLQSEHRWHKSQAVSSTGLVHIQPLGRELGQAVLRRWLAEAGRNLSHQQWAIVDKSLAHCSRPIFVKLAFGEVVNWKSYSMRGDARGLTFGSAWLTDFRPGAGPDQSELERLVCRREEEMGKGADEELRYKWQTLTMEQQWINYLDYNASKAAAAGRDDFGPDGFRPTGDVVIRIATTGAGTNRQGAPGHGGGAANPGSSFASASSASICHLSDTIEDAICQLFARIELKHGYLLTKHSLSYISAARNGICENELEDILSLDDVVLDDVFQYHLPPVRRIPPLLWTRIRNDLPDYLSERDADGIVLTWHHGQFQTVTEKRYMASERQLVYVHSLMADYFLGKWADKAKPFRCTRQQVQMAAEQLESAIQKSMRRDSDTIHAGRQSSSTGGNGSGGGGGTRGPGAVGLIGRINSGSANVRSGASFSLRSRLRSSDQHDKRLQWMQAKAHRRVPHQPLYYESGGQPERAEGESSPGRSLDRDVADRAGSAGTARSSADHRRRYNLRKLTELPYHLLRSGRFLELARHTLFNYQWLFASIDALGLQSLFVDCDEAVGRFETELAKRQARQKDGQTESAESAEIDAAPPQADELAVAARNHLTSAALRSLCDQLKTLVSTLRLSASVIHSNPQQLAPQLVGRLLPAMTANMDAAQFSPASMVDTAASRATHLEQLLDQCDRDGCSDCALLPVGHCLQSADGLQLSSLEGHPFGVMSMCLASDQRHLLSASSKFLMWNITTGEVARDVDPGLSGAIVMQLLLSSNNKIALAYTSDDQILSLEISTQQVVRESLTHLRCRSPDGSMSSSAASREPSCEEHGADHIKSMRLIDERTAKRAFVWLDSGRVVVLRLDEADSRQAQRPQQNQDGVSISVHYELDCLALEGVNSGGPLERRVLDVAIQQTGAHSDLLLVLTGSGSGSGESMQLATMRLVRPRRDSIDEVRVWAVLEAKLIALGPSLGQVVTCGHSQDEVFLRRRRATSWSVGKRLCRPEPDQLSAKSVLAVELEAGLEAVEEDDDEQTDWSETGDASGADVYTRLVEFERELDGTCEEIQPVRAAFSGARRKSSLIGGCGRVAARRAAKFAKIYQTDHIDVLQLLKPRSSEAGGQSDHAYERFRLALPRDTRNVSLDFNRSQLSSKIVPRDELAGGAPQTQHYLVVVATRRLLVYSLEGEQLLKCIEAHSGRITALWTVRARARSDNGDSPQAAGASALVTSSMDKTVKIWSLANLEKEGQTVARLASAAGGRQFDSISLSSQRPLACCLSRGHLSVWDWQNARLLSGYESYEELVRHEADKHQRREPDADATTSARSRVALCKFSKNGRYLALASESSDKTTVSLMAVEGSAQLDGTARRVGIAANSSQVNFRLWASREVAGEAVAALKLKFLSQDSRLLVVTTANRTGSCPTDQRASTSGSSPGQQTPSGSARQTSSSPRSSTSSHLSDGIRISVLTVPEVRHIYRIECAPPKHAPGDEKQARSRDLLHGAFARKAHRDLLVTVTCDHQLIVAVQPRSGSASSESSRPASAGDGQPPLVLNVYSARNGQLVKAVDLSQLQVAAVVPRHEARGSQGHTPAQADELLQAGPDARAHRRQPTGLDQSRRRASFVAVRADQFNRLKAVADRDRQSIVALMDDERGASWFVDVTTKTLLAQTSNWSGRLSTDGRYGLSRMYATSGQSEAEPSVSAGGLRLLEMHHHQQVKSLLSLSQFEALMRGGQPATGERVDARPGTLTTGQSDIICGFSKPNDDYVYFCESRSRQLLLVRIRDGHLLANYRLPAAANCIKSSADGLALIVGLSDGTLLALAIVDPQSSETFMRLGQYPTRRMRRGHNRPLG